MQYVHSDLYQQIGESYSDRRMEVSYQGRNDRRQGNRINCQAGSYWKISHYYRISYLRQESKMICDICGRKGARIRKVSRTYGKGKDLLVIENIPVVSCPHCGESYLTAETLHEIERLKLHRKTLAVERPVEFLSFA